MRPQTHPAVQKWLDKVDAGDLFLSATALAELRVGIAILPVGCRKAYLTAALDQVLNTLFRERILAFDTEAAESFALVVSRARKVGRAIQVADGQIAAIAAVRGFVVATRDVGPFEAAGVGVVNPWEA
jgi:predicted nucleic acid-binding protein